MLEGIDINQRIEFVSKEDDSEPKTIFVFRPLSGIEMFSIYKSTSNKEEVDILKFIETTVVEIKNIKGGISKDDFLRSLNMRILAELLDKANSVNNLSPEDKKKL